MMNRKMIQIALFVSLILCVISSISSAQNLELRHRLQAGETAQVLTDVQMQGDSFLTGTKAATQLRMQMLRILQVGAVDAVGNAKVEAAVSRIRTQGKMENASFNKDLTGQELQSVMFGADRMNMEITPLGHVSGQDDVSLQQLGITLPSSLGDSGGFEFPTFPSEMVRVGDMWTENGQLLRGVTSQRSNLSGQCVYKLYRIQTSSQGRVAIIRYSKVSDLSGLGLGGTTLGSQGTSLDSMGTTPQNPGTTGTGVSAQVGGLVIQLNGEIEFNIDQGRVVKTTQQGTWNMNMDIGAASAAATTAAMAGNPLSPMSNSNLSAKTNGVRNTQQKTNLKQTMKIQLTTQFQWTGQQKAQQAQKVYPSVDALTPLVDSLPKSATKAEALP